MNKYWILIPLLFVMIGILGAVTPNIPLPHNERLYNGCDHIWDFEYRARPHCIKCGVEARNDFEIQEWYQNRDTHLDYYGVYYK